MSDTGATVLLVGDTAARSATVRKWLSLHRHSSVAKSHDLVLCKYQLADHTAFPLLDWLEGSISSLVLCAKSGRGSRWLPVIERGERRLDRRLLRANNLPCALESILNGRARKCSAASKVSTEHVDRVGVE